MIFNHRTLYIQNEDAHHTHSLCWLLSICGLVYIYIYRLMHGTPFTKYVMQELVVLDSVFIIAPIFGIFSPVDLSGKWS